MLAQQCPERAVAHAVMEGFQEPRSSPVHASAAISKSVGSAPPTEIGSTKNGSNVITPMVAANVNQIERMPSSRAGPASW